MSEDRSRFSISVVIPVYNVAPYVERCLRSLMQQNYQAAECIIVDDASTDDSIERCQKLIDEYSGPTQFVVTHHERNRGLSAARNTGTKAATSDYIYYLDGDDYITQDCLELLISPIKKDSSIEMVMGNYEIDCSTSSDDNDRKGQITSTRQLQENTYYEFRSNEELCQWFYDKKSQRSAHVWNKLLNLSFVKEHQLYNKEGLLFEDALWSFYLMRNLGHGVFSNRVTYFYTRRPGSIATSVSYEEKMRFWGYIHKEIAEQITPYKRREEAEFWVADFCQFLIDAYKNPDFQYAYKVYYRKLSENHVDSTARYLKIIHHLSKTKAGRLIYTYVKQCRNKVRKIDLLFQH